MIINVIAFTGNGCQTASNVKHALENEDIVHAYCKTTHDTHGLTNLEGKISEYVEDWFESCDAIVFIGAVGIAVRYIAPYVKSKVTDPAVVSMDEHGRWCIALLSGHIGGSNQLVRRISDALGCEAVITTATDINDKFAVDTFAVRNKLRLEAIGTAKDVAARILDGRFVGFCSDIPVEGKIGNGLTLTDKGEFGVCISYEPLKSPFERTLILVPMDIIIGVGCRRGIEPEKLRSFVCEHLKKMKIVEERVGGVCSIILKKDELAINELAKYFKVPARFYTSEQLNSIPGEFTKSEFVKTVASVDCVCERSACMMGTELICRKTICDGMTLAISRVPIIARFI